MKLLLGSTILLFALLHHVVHECGHVILAKFNGIKVKRIHWFTYSRFGGTRVYYEDEPEMGEELVNRKWGIAAAGGFVTTLIIGYLSILIYIIFGNLQSRVCSIIMYSISLVFLLGDPVYFTLGSLFNGGDIRGIVKAFRIKRWAALSISIFILSINILLIKFIWY